MRVRDAGTRRVYTRRLRTVHAALALLSSTVVAITAIGSFAHGSPGLGVVSGGVVLGAGLLLCGGILRRAVVVTPGWVTVRGLLTTRRIPAAAVARFEPPAPYGKLWGSGLRIVLADGTTRTCGAFTNTPVDVAPAGVAESDELNGWLALQAGGSVGAARLPDRRPDGAWRTAAWYGWLGLLALFVLSCLVVVLAAMSDPAFGT